ncbi:hypothetical protein [Sinorhizobium fredii]|uniref:hypothetical protein n=1 Tax=Rhizobium fredii TaxID=380 RepID=UPI003514CED0
MKDDERIWTVNRILSDYVKSPSLRHIRDSHSLMKLAQAIVKQLDRHGSVWQKWEGQREVLLKSAVGCWIPVEDMRDVLNRMPGPKLTTTDVTQRLKAFEEEPYSTYPNEGLRDGCLELYSKEKAEGSELSAIVGLIAEHVEREEERLRIEHKERYKRLREEERIAAEERLLSGADCKWTQLRKSQNWYCRSNGRTYRLSPTTDKKWQLFRVDTLSAEEKGRVIGKYQNRGDATKVIAQVAYQSEPKR